LVAVVGAVGSGKSSFIGALLGNMYLHEGSVEVRGSIAFCDQTPWILNSTVEGNILFGAQKNQLRFDLAVKAACLDEDLKILPAGINTEIGFALTVPFASLGTHSLTPFLFDAGERGINLSGGQKARVSLARAIYMNSDIYLLDDPLAAVDVRESSLSPFAITITSFSSLVFSILPSTRLMLGKASSKVASKKRWRTRPEYWSRTTSTCSPSATSSSSWRTAA
jgi:ABC-type multidrug transport system fused ATPase/permease subunit